MKNTPGGSPTSAPILIVQGDADTIVAPDVTERLMHELYRNGETVKLRLAPGVGHLATGHEAAPAVLEWISDRFAGKPPPTSSARFRETSRGWAGAGNIGAAAESLHATAINTR